MGVRTYLIFTCIACTKFFFLITSNVGVRFMCKFQLKAIFGQCTPSGQFKFPKFCLFGGGESCTQRRVIRGVMQYMQETKQFAL